MNWSRKIFGLTSCMLLTRNFTLFSVPPEINSWLTNQSIPLNSTFAIKCYVRGDPPPKVNWSKDGLDLANKENTLTIDIVTFGDAGWYGCSAENRAGKIRRIFWIDVTGK